MIKYSLLAVLCRSLYLMDILGVKADKSIKTEFPGHCGYFLNVDLGELLFIQEITML